MENRILPAVEEGQQQKRKRYLQPEQRAKLERRLAEGMDESAHFPACTPEQRATLWALLELKQAESTLSQIRQVLEKLKPLEEKASPAPWIFESWLDPETEILVSEPLEDSNYTNHHAPVLMRGYDEPDSTINTNWVLVQELRNAYPELLALVGKEK